LFNRVFLLFGNDITDTTGIDNANFQNGFMRFLLAGVVENGEYGATGTTTHKRTLETRFKTKTRNNAKLTATTEIKMWNLLN
jgi:hypothetical protein